MKKILCLLLSTTMIALCLTGLAYAEQRDKEAAVIEPSYLDVFVEEDENVFPPIAPKGIIMKRVIVPQVAYASYNEQYDYIDSLGLPDTFPEQILETQTVYKGEFPNWSSGDMTKTAIVSSLAELDYYYANFFEESRYHNIANLEDDTAQRGRDMLNVYEKLRELDYSKNAVMFLSLNTYGAKGVTTGRLVVSGDCLIYEKLYDEDAYCHSFEIHVVKKADLPAIGEDLKLFFYLPRVANEDSSCFDKYRLLAPNNYYYFEKVDENASVEIEDAIEYPSVDIPEEILKLRLKNYENAPLASLCVEIQNGTNTENGIVWGELALSAEVLNKSLNYEVLYAWGDSQYRFNRNFYESAVITNVAEASSFIFRKGEKPVTDKIVGWGQTIEEFQLYTTIDYSEKAVIVVYMQHQLGAALDIRLDGISIYENNLIVTLCSNYDDGSNYSAGGYNGYVFLVDKADLPNNGEGLNLYYHIADEANEIAQSETVTATMCSFPATFREWIPGRDFTVTYEEYRRDMIENYWENRSEIDFPYGGIQGDSQIDTPWN